MEVRIQTGKLTRILSIINAYAHDRNYEFGEISDYWETLGNYLSNRPKKPN